MFGEGIPLLDTDDDGMPDFWEASFGLNLNVDDTNDDNDNDGYTNIEEYLNKTDPNTAGILSSSSMATLTNAEIDYESIYESLTFSIDSVFPNPIIGDISNMKFTVNRPAEVSLKVLDEDGKEVNSLVSAFLYEGQYQIQWNSTGLRAGIYFVVLMSKDNSASYKLIVNK